MESAPLDFPLSLSLSLCLSLSSDAISSARCPACCVAIYRLVVGLHDGWRLLKMFFGYVTAVTQQQCQVYSYTFALQDGPLLQQYNLRKQG
jgi:hypothetical protein